VKKQEIVAASLHGNHSAQIKKTNDICQTEHSNDH